MKTSAFVRWVVAWLATLAFSPAAMAIVTGAVWTTDSLGTVDTNVYPSQRDPDTNACLVFLSGGPHGASGNQAMIDGTYYYQVTNPSGSMTLSQSDASTRTLQVVNGNVVGPIELCDFDVSPNGVYKAWAIRASLPNGDPLEDCQIATNGRELIVTGPNGHNSIDSCSKTDNFRIETDDGDGCTAETCPCECGFIFNPETQQCEGKPCVTPTDPSILVEKTASGLYDLPWSWVIAKSVCANGTGGEGQPPCLTTVKQQGGSVLFNYLLTLTPTAGSPQNYEVVGNITISAQDGNDSNGDPVYATGFQLLDEIAYGEALVNDLNASCELDTALPTEVKNGTPAVLPYHCAYDPDLPAADSEVNQVRVISSNAKETGTGNDEATALAPFTFAKDQDIDDCVNVTDAYNGALPVPVGTTICINDPTKTISYQKSVTVENGCKDVNNTASFTTDDTSTAANPPASATVRVCGSLKTGALTIGFWQNKNGQDIIGKYCLGGPQTLQAFLTGYNPFKDAPYSCSNLQKYVTDIIKSANASGASMNAMLRAQMLATALNVYFSDAAWNKIGGPTNLGAQVIDLTQVCKNISACTIYEDTSSAFDGSPKSVSQLLSIAGNIKCNGTGYCKTAGWYVVGSAQSKSLQELAKDTFDAINNQKAFGI